MWFPHTNQRASICAALVINSRIPSCGAAQDAASGSAPRPFGFTAICHPMNFSLGSYSHETKPPPNNRAVPSYPSSVQMTEPPLA